MRSINLHTLRYTTVVPTFAKKLAIPFYFQINTDLFPLCNTHPADNISCKDTYAPARTAHAGMPEVLERCRVYLYFPDIRCSTRLFREPALIFRHFRREKYLECARRRCALENMAPLLSTFIADASKLGNVPLGWSLLMLNVVLRCVRLPLEPFQGNVLSCGTF